MTKRSCFLNRWRIFLFQPYYRSVFVFFLCAPISFCAQRTASKPRIEAVRFWSFSDVTRIAIETQGEYRLTSDHLDSPPRLVFDLRGLRPPAARQKGIRIFRVGDRLIRQIRIAETEPGMSRVVIDLEVPAAFTSSQLIHPDRLIIEIHPKHKPAAESLATRSRSGVHRSSDVPLTAGTINEHPNTPELILPVLVMPPVTPPVLFSKFVFPSRLNANATANTSVPKSTLVWNGVVQTPRESVSAITISPNSRTETVIAGPVSPAKTDDSNRSLVRIFGLKIHRVVIDAGHGGHDTGTIGPNGLAEKDLVLDVALRLGKLVQQRLGAEVTYTRRDDTFIPLEQRTKIANDKKADLFISIHANSSPAPAATGVETYYFNFTTDQHSIDLATRENASSTSSIFQLNDLLHKAVLNAKVEESREFAQKIQTSLQAMSVRMNSGSRDRGVKKAPFVVLIGASMPSILAEVGFVSNPRDEKLLRRDDQRQKIAESLFKGVSGYASSLSHVQIARANGK